jgi:Fe-S-cluster containining protein
MFSNYNNLVHKVDALADKVYEKYADKITCKKGCSSCCEKILTFFPVEFFFIVDYINKNDIDKALIKDNVKSIKRDAVLRCPFLYKKECLIYDARPIICRTFGMPAIMVDDDRERVELQICPENFKDKSYKIEKEYLFNLNTLNGMLSVINSVFVDAYKGYDNKKERLGVMDIVNCL